MASYLQIPPPSPVSPLHLPYSPSIPRVLPPSPCTLHAPSLHPFSPPCALCIHVGFGPRRAGPPRCCMQASYLLVWPCLHDVACGAGHEAPLPADMAPKSPRGVVSWEPHQHPGAHPRQWPAQPPHPQLPIEARTAAASQQVPCFAIIRGLLAALFRHHQGAPGCLVAGTTHDCCRSWPDSACGWQAGVSTQLDQHPQHPQHPQHIQFAQHQQHPQHLPHPRSPSPPHTPR